MKKDALIETTEEHTRATEILKSDMMEVKCNIATNKTGFKICIFSDASYHGANFVLTVENYVIKSDKDKNKTYAHALLFDAT